MTKAHEIVRCPQCDRPCFWVVDNSSDKNPNRFLADLHVPTYAVRLDNPMSGEPHVMKVVTAYVPHVYCCPKSCDAAGRVLMKKVAAREAEENA